MTTLDTAILVLVDAALTRGAPSIVVVDRDQQKMTVLPLDQWVRESGHVPREARSRIARDARARHGEAVMVLTLSNGTVNVFASRGSQPEPEGSGPPSASEPPEGSGPPSASEPPEGSEPTLETESPGAGSSGSES